MSAKTNNKETVKLEDIKAKLILEKERVLSNLEFLSKKDANEVDGQSTSFPEFGDKPDENALEVEAYSNNLGSQEVLESALSDIEKALEKIENGTYGICKYCGKAIGEKRLEIRPTASSCVDCKTKLQETE